MDWKNKSGHLFIFIFLQAINWRRKKKSASKKGAYKYTELPRW